MTGPGPDTCRRLLAEAERASLQAATEAAERGAIRQREVAPGVWTLLPKEAA